MSEKNCECEECMASDPTTARQWAEAGGQPEPYDGQDGRLTVTFPQGGKMLAAYMSACRVLGFTPDLPLMSRMEQVIRTARASIATPTKHTTRTARQTRQPTRLRMVRGRS